MPSVQLQGDALPFGFLGFDGAVKHLGPQLFQALLLAALPFQQLVHPPAIFDLEDAQRVDDCHRGQRGHGSPQHLHREPNQRMKAAVFRYADGKIRLGRRKQLAYAAIQAKGQGARAISRAKRRHAGCRKTRRCSSSPTTASAAPGIARA